MVILLGNLAQFEVFGRTDAKLKSQIGFSPRPQRVCGAIPASLFTTNRNSFGAVTPNRNLKTRKIYLPVNCRKPAQLIETKAPGEDSSENRKAARGAVQLYCACAASKLSDGSDP
jgi:hypothetical protein